jgi:hypothetical protein
MPGDFVGVAPDGSELVLRDRDVLTAYKPGLAAMTWSRRIEPELHGDSGDGRKTLEVQIVGLLQGYFTQNVRQARARVSSAGDAGLWLEVSFDLGASARGETSLQMSAGGASTLRELASTCMSAGRHCFLHR